MKLLTITVPCYNAEAYMEHCLDTLASAGDKVEIIIIDDGSTDKTGEIADRYAAANKNITVVHQENGGHGEGINRGLTLASGKYFKVIDSDDYVDPIALKTVIASLEKAESKGGIDMMITNYVYEHVNSSDNTTVRYNNVFPHGKIVGWRQIKSFGASQYITIHSSLFRTSVLRECGVTLPKHTLYEDNYFIYMPLPFVKKMCWLDVDLYHYTIGREGQSVSKAVLIKKCSHQRVITEMIFNAYDVSKIARHNPNLAKYMMHELQLMAVVTTAFSRLSHTKEEDDAMRDMWDRIISRNPRMGIRMRYLTPTVFVGLPGIAGGYVGTFLYGCVHKFIKFN